MSKKTDFILTFFATLWKKVFTDCLATAAHGVLSAFRLRVMPKIVRLDFTRTFLYSFFTLKKKKLSPSGAQICTLGYLCIHILSVYGYRVQLKVKPGRKTLKIQEKLCFGYPFSHNSCSLKMKKCQSENIPPLRPYPTRTYHPSLPFNVASHEKQSRQLFKLTSLKEVSALCCFSSECSLTLSSKNQ